MILAFIYTLLSASPSQQFVSLDIYQEYQECVELDSNGNSKEVGFGHLEYEYEYTYTLVATVDLPVPTVNKEKTSSEVCICFGVDENGQLSYEVLNNNEDEQNLKRTSLDDYDTDANAKRHKNWSLTLFIFVVFTVYVCVKIIFADLRLDEYESSNEL